MSDLIFQLDWIPYPEGIMEYSDTVARLGIIAGPHCLTRNEDIDSSTVRDHITVALHPLAEWFAWSWWRLLYEPLPNPQEPPPHDWRMSHEIVAVGEGYVWPAISFATDGESVQISARAFADKCAPMKYLTDTQAPVSVSMDRFQSSVSSFMEKVLARLSEHGKGESDLAGLWRLTQSEMADEKIRRLRRLEAEMGYDPEECPEGLLRQAIVLADKLGETTLRELAPAYSKRDIDTDSEADADLDAIKTLTGQNGLMGTPQIGKGDFGRMADNALPWQRAVEAARRLRKSLDMDGQPIANSRLYGLLGLTENMVEGWTPTGKAKASVAGRKPDGAMNYVSRKKHPIGKRFEFARFIADHAYGVNSDRPRWLVATDLSTSRQKFQRAFAAEFLCPIESLVDYMEHDFSETAVEDAANHFAVSEVTVNASLMNNGHIEPAYPTQGISYSMGTRAAA